MQSKSYLVLIFHFIAVSAFAQATITANDYRNLIGVPQIFGNYASFDVTGLPGLISASGANQTWDITGRTYFKIDSSEYIYFNYPGAAPMANDPAFTGCNLVVRTKDLWNQSPVTNWQFCTLHDTGFLAYGSVVDSAGYSQVASKNSPPILSYKFPMTYNTSWMSTTTITNAGGFVTNATYTNLVDGYGNITTPTGSFSCLRIRQRIDAETGWPIPASSTTYNYYFIGKDTPYGIGTVMVDKNGLPYMVNYVDVKLFIPVEKPADVSLPQFQLMQNYPNPFNSSTVIEFYLSHSSNIILKIFNLSGEEVSILKTENFAAGRHFIRWDAGGVASGVYFYCLKAGSFIDTKKLILIR